MTTDQVEKWLESNGFDYKSEASARAAAQVMDSKGLLNSKVKGFLKGSRLSGTEYLKTYRKEKSWAGYYNETRFINRVQKKNDDYKMSTLSMLQRAASHFDLQRIDIDENYEVSKELTTARQNLINFMNIHEQNIKEGKNLGELGQELDRITEFRGTSIPAGLKNVLRRQYGEIVSLRLQKRLVIPQYKSYEQRETYIKEVARSIAPQRISRGETDVDYAARINDEWKDIVPVSTLRSWFTEYELK